ncbi:peptidyl-prolyl cis-trans isomerase G-like isoform X2 [Planococcus citri]|uniref:peptidyl-prolyl cis-trans isomerase G-like isoform X2 n=1 Tax=Planococcus citri TaxID=170843 RepID=UPI0031F84FD6
MKESKIKRENSGSKKKKHAKSVNLDSWDQSDLEFADEKVLEKRLHQLKLQLRLAQDDSADSGRSSKHAKNKKKPPSDDSGSSDSDDSSDSDSSFSSASSSSVNRCDNRKSSSGSDDNRKKRARTALNNKTHVKDYKSHRSPIRNERENHSSKNDRKLSVRRKISPTPPSKHSSRVRSKRSPSLDKKEVYSRGDTSRWHDKAKEAGRERSKYEKERSKSRGRGRLDRRSPSVSRDRTLARSKDRNVRNVVRTTSVSSRRKESPEPRSRVYDSGRRAGALFMHKNSPREDRLGSNRHDDKRLDVKVTARRNDIRAGDIRDSNLRITKDVRGDRKEPPSIKMREPSRDREAPLKLRRESPIHRADPRDRNRVIEDRLKDRDKKIHDRLEPDRNNRNIRNDNRDVPDDKFRRNDRSSDTARPNNRYGNESVFDRMRNRYNDRRNAENQRFARTERDRVGSDMRKDRINDKDTIKSRIVESNGNDRPFRDRRIAPIVRPRSPYRDRKEPLRVDRRSPLNFERKFSSPTATRKARDDNRSIHNKRKSLENDDPQWNKRKSLNKTRSRSRSSEKRKRRRSSQEEWRIIDMTSPVLDDELSDETTNNVENNTQKLKRPTINKIRNKFKTEDSDDNDSKNKTILTDELSDISDEDFNDINTNNSIKNRRDNLTKADRQFRLDKNNRKSFQQKEELDLNKSPVDQDNKNSPTRVSAPNDVDDLIEEREKLSDDETRVDIEKTNEHLDSEEDTVSRVSDAIGVDWAELVEESKRKTPAIEESSKLIRKKWSGVNMFSKIGISEKYAGKELFEEIQNELNVTDNDDDKNIADKFHHSIAGLHVCLRDKSIKRKTLFEPYKTAISARKDINMRRRLCGLPVKNINSQQIISICN